MSEWVNYLIMKESVLKPLAEEEEKAGIETLITMISSCVQNQPHIDSLDTFCSNIRLKMHTIFPYLNLKSKNHFSLEITKLAIDDMLKASWKLFLNNIKSEFPTVFEHNQSTSQRAPAKLPNVSIGYLKSCFNKQTRTNQTTSMSDIPINNEMDTSNSFDILSSEELRAYTSVVNKLSEAILRSSQFKSINTNEQESTCENSGEISFAELSENEIKALEYYLGYVLLRSKQKLDTKNLEKKSEIHRIIDILSNPVNYSSHERRSKFLIEPEKELVQYFYHLEKKVKYIH